MVLESTGLPSMQVCQEEIKKPAFANFLKDMKSSYLEYDLPSYLVTPISRFPRYMLLIKEFMKRLPQIADGVHNYLDSFEQMLQAMNRMYGVKSIAFSILPVIRNLKVNNTYFC